MNIPGGFGQPKEEFSPTTLIIFYDAGIGKEPLLKAIEDYHATVIYDLKIMKSISIKIPDGTKIEDAIDYFNKVEGVLQVNRDRIRRLDSNKNKNMAI